MPDALGRNFNELVLRDELKALLKGKNGRRREAQRLVGTGGAHVCDMLFLCCGNHEILVARTFADDLPFIYRNAGADEHPAALLGIEQAVAGGFARFMVDDGTMLALLNVSLVRLIPVENVAHHAVAARVRQKFAAVAHEPAGRDEEQQADAAFGFGDLSCSSALREPSFSITGTDIFLRHVDRQLLDRLKERARLIALEDDLRAGNGEFVFLAGAWSQ